jgi:hypothetical protein
MAALRQGGVTARSEVGKPVAHRASCATREPQVILHLNHVTDDLDFGSAMVAVVIATIRGGPQVRAVAVLAAAPSNGGGGPRRPRVLPERG